MVIRNKLEFAKILAKTKNKFFSIKTKEEESISCRFHKYLNGRFIFMTRTSHMIINYNDVSEIKTKGKTYVVKK